MIFKVLRRGTPRCIGLLSVLVVLLLCVYYISIGQITNSPRDFLKKRTLDQSDLVKYNFSENDKIKNSKLVKNPKYTNKLSKKCAALKEAPTDLTTVDEYQNFDFQPSWMRTKEYWDMSFETRYESLKKSTTRPPLKVIIVPFSHNDPGWLKTFLGYFQSDSRNILNFVISKMQEYKDMTFIWAEISILQLWWDQAHPTKQRALKHLIQSGRFEIATGGWVMTDEANVHVYAMVDQLIEGHQWLRETLNYTPTTGFSIDPFGHGSTLPYLLAASDFEGTIIQRVHYAWKQFLAKMQYGDFLWRPYWTTDDESRTMLTHNMPFDIYSIKHSCGPHPFICLNFDFRKLPNEYTEYSIKAQFITNENIQAKADLLLEQYSKTASLFPHNVALIPLGDDFRYNKEREIDQQYVNYKMLIDYINNNPKRYNNAEISFGLPNQYFKEIKRRYNKYPSLKGDFFVYSDIFTEGRPAYWSGYFTTRPLYKMLSRELEHNLRAAEIVFTVALNMARQHRHLNALRLFEKNYEKMIVARRNLGLFQHHDAITGTSKAIVMRDYGFRLFGSLQDTVHLQESAIELLVQSAAGISKEHNFVLSELERESFNKLPRKTPINVQRNRSIEIILYNSLAQERLEVVTLRTQTPHVKIFDHNDQEVNIQINPVWNITETFDGTQVNNLCVSTLQYEILLVANFPPLSLLKYTAKYSDNIKKKPSPLSTIYCNECKTRNLDETQTVFDIKKKQPGDIQLENFITRLLFDGTTGFLKSITPKHRKKTVQCAIKFAAYRSAQFHSGAYLFKPDREEKDSEKDVFENTGTPMIFITSGQLASDVTVIYGNLLAHTVRIYNTGTALDNAIYIENDIDFEQPPKNRETELFMRLVTNIDNGANPVFYTDLNGFQHQRREKVSSLGIEANYFPITASTFIQDNDLRLTLLTTHAQGAASLEPGYLEVMLDRRTLYDDYRGMGEGIVDNRLTRQRYWLVLENFHEGINKKKDNGKIKRDHEIPSYYVNQLSNIHNYPVNLYFFEKSEEMSPIHLKKMVSLFKLKFPCDVHLMTLRTQSDNNLPLFPSRSALFVLHRQAFSCKIKELGNLCNDGFGSDFVDDSLKLLKNVDVESAYAVSLTGAKQYEQIFKFKSISIKPMDILTFNLTFIEGESN